MTMLKIALLSALVSVTVGGALLEGLFDQVPPGFIQFNGILIICCTLVFIASALKFRFKSERK